MTSVASQKKHSTNWCIFTLRNFKVDAQKFQVADFMQTPQKTNKNAVKWFQSLTEYVSHCLLGDQAEIPVGFEYHQASGQKSG